MRKTLLTMVGCLLLGSSQVWAADFENAKEAVKNMGVGWNLGNTLDANDASKTWTTTADHETCWGQPVTKPELITMMKEAGFGAIRVPVTWYQEMDANGKVNDAWMSRVKEVVDYVIDNGMYCILNVHHDTGADGGSFKSWLKASNASYTANKDKFEGLWKQIAETFKDYDQHLLFEGYNEMLDENNCWNYPTWYSNGTGYNEASAKDSYDAINKYAQSFVDAVRATGGNNAVRNLIVNTYGACSGGVWGNNTHPMEPLTEMKLPDDAVENHLIFEVHNYPSITSGINSAKSTLDSTIEALKTHLVSKGAPVIFGEWGTSNVDNGSDYTDRHDTMVEFLDYFVKKCKENDIATFYWMGLSDGAARSLPAFNQPDLAETISKAYHGSDFSGKYPTQDNFQIDYIVKYNDEWSELFLYGSWISTATLKMSEYKGIRVEMENDSYVGKLQVKLYGNDSKENYIPLTGAVTTINFSDSQAAIGNEVLRITLQTLAGSQTARLKNAKLIKADGSETAATVTVAWGCEVTTESVPMGIRSIPTVTSDADNAIYTLSGQRVTTPRQGIYIRNGKKFIAR